MSKHKKYIDGYENNSLHLDLFKLRYDALSNIIFMLGFTILDDAITDFEKDRVQLSEKLEQAADLLMEAGRKLESAWNICKKHMDDNEIS